MVNGIYQRRNSGSVGDGNVVTKIQVVNGVIVEAWHDVPGGQWRGNDPTYLHGLQVDDGYLKENRYHLVQKV